jgi:YihY family inner membrane protein
MAAGIVFFLAMTLTSVAATAAAHADRFPVIANLHNRLWFWDTALAWVVQGALAVGVCYLVYQTMPNGRVSARAAWAAALPAGFLWNGSRSLFAVFVTASSRYGELYGPLAGAIALLVWIYVSAHIVIYCGEIGATLQARYWPPKERR